VNDDGGGARGCFQACGRSCSAWPAPTADHWRSRPAPTRLGSGAWSAISTVGAERGSKAGNDAARGRYGACGPRSTLSGLTPNTILYPQPPVQVKTLVESSPDHEYAYGSARLKTVA
jgi:hypothetical protein